MPAKLVDVVGEDDWISTGNDTSSQSGLFSQFTSSIKFLLLSIRIEFNKLIQSN